MSGGNVAYKLLFFKLIQFLIGTLHNYQLLPQDFADSLASHLSTTLSVSLFLIIMAKMFFIGTLECLTPAEWPEAWEKAAEAYCYSDGTYAVPHSLANRTDGTEWSVKLRLDYYYWIPYIIIGQAVILKTPDFFWHYTCDLLATKPTETLKAFAFLVGHQEVVGREADKKMVKKISNCVERQSWSDRLSGHLLSRDRLVNFDTWHLFSLYMAFKALRLAALLLSLLYLKTAFGLDSVLFGASMARDSLQGVPWEATDLFPRWAFCDVRMRLLGQWITRPTQCALPINLLVEKVLLLLWWWVVCCAIFLLAAVTWGVRMLPGRREAFARAFLAISESLRSAPAESRRKLESRDQILVHRFSATDRAFMLRLVEERLGLAAAYLAMDSMVDAHINSVV